MSTSQFDGTVTVPNSQGIVPKGETFSVGGQLGDDAQEGEIRIFVMIQQSQHDKNGGTDTTPLAIGQGLGTRVATGKWEAEVTVQSNTAFEKGSAVGTALSVQYSSGKDEAIGFETYAWTAQLMIKSPDAASET